MALQAFLAGDCPAGYARELAATCFAGERRIAKAAMAIGQMTGRSPFAGYLKTHSAEILSALRSPADRTLILAALVVARYEFAFDVLTILGRHFHAQDLVPTALITKKAAEKYMAGEKQLTNALYYLLPTLAEAGMLLRPRVGWYAIAKVSPQTTIALDAYREAFLRWNPNTDPDDIGEHPFFEFIATP